MRAIIYNLTSSSFKLRLCINWYAVQVKKEKNIDNKLEYISYITYRSLAILILNQP